MRSAPRIDRVSAKVDAPDVTAFRIGRTTDMDGRARWYSARGFETPLERLLRADKSWQVETVEAMLLEHFGKHRKLDNDALDSRGGTNDGAIEHFVYLALKRQTSLPA